jgi:AcrR family transcriptional regulator
MADNTARRLESDMSGPSGRNRDNSSASWGRPPARPAKPARRRESISHTAIVNGTIDLLDRDGLDALSMRRLADELGIGAASLYWHVGSKDGLLDLVLDQVVGETKIPGPDPGRWQDQIKDVARAQRAANLRHPWFVRVAVGRISMGPNSLRHSEHVLAILRAAGIPAHVAVQSYLLLVSAVNGFTIDETGVDDSPNVIDLPRDGESRQHAAEMARDYFAALPPSQFPNMTALAEEFVLADADERFEFLIDTFVDGLARQRADAATPAGDDQPGPQS